MEWIGDGCRCGSCAPGRRTRTCGACGRRGSRPRRPRAPSPPRRPRGSGGPWRCGARCRAGPAERPWASPASVGPRRRGGRPSRERPPTAANWSRSVLAHERAPASAGSELRVTSRVRSEAAMSGCGQPARPSRPASTMTSWPLRSRARSCSASGSHSGSRLGACSWARMPGRNQGDRSAGASGSSNSVSRGKGVGQCPLAQREGEVDQPAGGFLGAVEVAGEDRGGTGRVGVDQEHGTVPVEGEPQRRGGDAGRTAGGGEDDQRHRLSAPGRPGRVRPARSRRGRPGRRRRLRGPRRRRRSRRSPARG